MTTKIDAQRWDLLQQFGLLEPATDGIVDNLLRAAAQLCDAPMATLSFADRTRERFYACHGCTFDKLLSARGFGDYVVSGNCSLLVGDVRTDTRFRKVPLLEAHPDIRFYAGVPVVSRSGIPLGTLAVMDRTARHLPEGKLAALAALGAQVMLQIEFANQHQEAPRDVPSVDFDVVFSALPGSHWLLEPQELCVVGVSESGISSIAQQREDVLGKPIERVLLADRDDAATKDSVRKQVAAVRRCADTGQPTQLIAHPYPMLVPGKDNARKELETRYWNIVIAPVRERDGAIVYLTAHAVDVTELVRLREREGRASRDRKLLESQAARLEQDILQRSKEIERLFEHLHMAQAVANVGSWEIDLQGNAHFWSDEVYKVLGIEPGATIKHDPLLDAAHPDDRARVLAQRREARQTGRQLEITHRIVRPDGAVRHVHQQVRAMHAEQGEAMHLYGTVQDITRQKMIEDELHTRARQQEVVARFGQKALTGKRLEDLIDEAAEIVTDTLDVEYCKVLKLLPGGKAMQLVAGRGWKEDLIGKAVVSIGRDSQAGYTLLQQHSVIVHDLRSDERFRGPALLREHGVVSGISVIINGKTQPWGALGAHTTRLRKFTQDDVNFFESIANILAEAAHLRRATDELSELATRNNALLSLSRRALRGCTRRELQAQATASLAQVLNVEYAKFAEMLDDGTGMLVVAGCGWKKGVVGHSVLAIGKSSQGGYVLHSKHAVCIQDLPSETRFRPSPMHLEHGVDSGIAVAVSGPKGPTGILGAHTTHRRTFLPEEMHFIEQVAEILGEAGAAHARRESRKVHEVETS